MLDKARTRGTVALNTVDFIRLNYGSSSHDRVVHALPVETRPAFLSPVRETEWVPLAGVLKYMEVSKALLGAEDHRFFARMGYFGGQQDRGRSLGVMVRTPDIAKKMAPIAWRTLYDAGWLEIKDEDPTILRVHDFVATRDLCERITGTLEFDSGDGQVRHSACVHDRSTYCEWLVRVGSMPLAAG